MGHSLYIPMSRMNFVAAVDAQILAAAGFFMRRRFFEDFTAAVHDCIIATSKPCHSPDMDWNDVDETEMLFPVIVKASLPRLTGVKTIQIDGKSVKPRACKVDDLKVNAICLVSFPLPLIAIEEVICPGPRTVRSLVNDPMLKDREFDFNVVSSENSSSYLTGDFGSVVGKIRVKGLNLDHLDMSFSAIGGCALMAEAAKRQDWNKEYLHVDQVLSCIDLVIANAAGLLSKKKMIEPLIFEKPSDGKEDQNTDASGLVSLGKLMLNNIGEEAVQKLVEAGDLENELVVDEKRTLKLANDICFSILIRECMLAHPDEKTAVDIINATVVKLKDLKKVQADHLPEIIDRLSKGLNLIIGIANGEDSVDVLFTRKTAWAPSVRAAGMLALRPNSNEAMNWPLEQRPGRASVDDYLRGMLLVGLYTGFTRLARSVKDDWQVIPDLVLMQVSGILSKPIIPVAESIWKMGGGIITGEKRLRYGDQYNASLGMSIRIGSIVTKYIDKSFMKIQDGTLSYQDHYILSSLARILDLWDSTEVKRKQGKLSLVWKLDSIVNALPEAEIETLPEDILSMIFHRIGMEFPIEMANDSSIQWGNDRHRFERISRYLDVLQIETKNVSEEEVQIFFRKGISLTKELLRLLKVGQEISTAQKKKIEELLVNSTLGNTDLIGPIENNYDTPREWVFIADTLIEMTAKKTKKAQDALSGLVTNSRELTQFATKIFGDEYVKQVLKLKKTEPVS
jgi:hypothetical protein